MYAFFMHFRMYSPLFYLITLKLYMKFFREHPLSNMIRAKSNIKFLRNHLLNKTTLKIYMKILRDQIMTFRDVRQKAPQGASLGLGVPSLYGMVWIMVGRSLRSLQYR